MRGLYGGDIIKSVNVIDSLYNKSKSNELNEETSNPEVAQTLLKVFFCNQEKQRRFEQRPFVMNYISL
jgi:hypothetical protein